METPGVSTWLPPGSQYRVKVIATDGLRTGEAASPASFTVLASNYLPLTVR